MASRSEAELDRAATIWSPPSGMQSDLPCLVASSDQQRPFWYLSGKVSQSCAMMAAKSDDNESVIFHFALPRFFRRQIWNENRPAWLDLQKSLDTSFTTGLEYAVWAYQECTSWDSTSSHKELFPPNELPFPCLPLNMRSLPLVPTAKNKIIMKNAAKGLAELVNQQIMRLRMSL